MTRTLRSGILWVALSGASVGVGSTLGDEPAVAPSGALVVVGGGAMPDSVREQFVSLAGGKAARIVVIPTASEDADKPAAAEGFLQAWRRFEPARLTLVHTRSRVWADAEEFIRPLAEATAVWLSGGDQNRLIEAYRGTAVERELRALLKRGGVIGGTSAGAAVMSEVMIRGGNPRAEVGVGFGFIRHAVVDQHFLRRSRFDRLYGVVAERPGLIGLGIDEGTALIIQGNRWNVVGRSFVVAMEPAHGGEPPHFASFGDGAHGKFATSGLPIVEDGLRAEDE